MKQRQRQRKESCKSRLGTSEPDGGRGQLEKARKRLEERGGGGRKAEREPLVGRLSE